MKKKYVAPSVGIFDVDEEILLGSDNFGYADDDWLDDSFWE